MPAGTKQKHEPVGCLLIIQLILLSDHKKHTPRDCKAIQVIFITENMKLSHDEKFFYHAKA